MGSIFKINQLAAWYDSFWDLVENGIETIIQGYISLMVNWFYTIYLVFSMVLDLIQALFRKMAGLEPYIVNGQVQSGTRDIALEIINSPVIKNIFWSMAILGVILLFITTFIAVIKSEYQPLEAKGANSKGRVIGKALKSFALMATVPVVALLGLFIGNALLNSIDMATSSSDNAKLSGRIFVVSAYEANRAREGSASYDEDFLERLETENHFGIFIESGSTGFIVETVADKIDDAFQNQIDAPTGQSVDFTVSKSENAILSWFYNKIGKPSYPDTFRISNYKLVWFYYDLRNFNFFIAIGTTIMLITILLQVLLGLIKRIYSLTILFVVAPPIMAISQLDDNMFKSWKKSFIGAALSAYSVIITMNIFIMLIPVLGQIDFFQIDSTMSAATIVAHKMFNYLAQLLIIIGGAVFFKDFSKELAGIIGGGDALGDGAGKSADFIKAASKATAITGALAKPVINAHKGAISGGAKAVIQGRQQGLTSWAAASQAASKAAQATKQNLKNFFVPTDSKGNKIGFLKDKTNKFTGSELYKKLGIGNVLTPNFKANLEKKKEKEQKSIEAQRHQELLQALGGKSETKKEDTPQISEMQAATESYLNVQKSQANRSLSGKTVPGINQKISKLEDSIKKEESGSAPDRAKIDAKKAKLADLQTKKDTILADLENEVNNVTNLTKVMQNSGTENYDDVINESNVNFKRFVYDKQQIQDTAKKLKSYQEKTKKQASK